MKILVAEDEKDLVDVYKRFLEENNHQVVTASNGAEALYLYSREFKKNLENKDDNQNTFDTVVLDYQMPRMDGLETAKEILAINPKQRIIFASAYLQQTLADSISNLNQIVELLQKPFGLQALIDTIEDREIYGELEKLNVNIKNLKEINPTHAQIHDYLAILTKLQKGRQY